MAGTKKRKATSVSSPITMAEFESLARFVTGTPDSALIIGFTGSGSLVVSLAMGGDSRIMASPNLYVIYEALLEAAASTDIPGEKLQ
jgi:hypothetical protein